MTVTLSPQTETLLQEHAGLLGQEAKELAEGFADIDAGRTVSFEEVRAQWEAEKAERHTNLPKRTGILLL